MYRLDKTFIKFVLIYALGVLEMVTIITAKPNVIPAIDNQTIGFENLLEWSSFFSILFAINNSVFNI